MILAVSISSGFRREIRDGVSAISGDILLAPVGQSWLNASDPVSSNPTYLESLKRINGVKSIDPTIYCAGMVKNEQAMEGVLFKGTDLEGEDLEVSIPSKLAKRLGLSVGDDMQTYFVGERVKIRKFKVASIYESILDTDDKLVVHAKLGDLQRVLGWDEDQVSGLEITLDDAFRNTSSTGFLTEKIGMTIITEQTDEDPSLVSSSSMSRYPQLFSWLDLLDFNVLFILLLMTVVAGFNMISGLLIMLFRNISTIGTLKSMGMTDRNISEVFLKVASNLIFKGMLIGNAIAFLFCIIQGSTHLIKLNPDNYFVSFVPVHLNVLGTIAADAAAYVVIMLLLLIPCLFISKIDPAQTVRQQ
ncbi:MAG: FtsX-like permease family protein [Bacteroidales bacterium]|nr:FtsX-like permease family protein [Bacteroidales bacterium]